MSKSKTETKILTTLQLAKKTFVELLSFYSMPILLFWGIVLQPILGSDDD